MTRNLFVQALVKFLCGAAVVALLLFASAGTLDWPAAWLFLGLLFVPMLGAGFVLMARNPSLLEKRLDAREKEMVQNKIIALSGGLFVLMFVLAGLDRRFGWTSFPWIVPAAASVTFLVFYLLYGEVLRENTWLSRTVEVQKGQKVVDSGLYSVVRHPMYFAASGLFLSMPLVLSSLPAFLVMIPFPLLLVRRIQNEEQVLKDGLPGYSEYMKKVKYRLIPYIW